MSKYSNTALLFAAAIPFLAVDAHAGFKSGASFHPILAPSIHPIARHSARPAPSARHPRLVAGLHGKVPHAFHKKFAHHHHKRFLGWELPVTPDAGAFYGSYYDPDTQGGIDPALLSDTGAFSGSPRFGAFYRTGCRSEEVSVPGSRGPTRVTVTRCSVPIPDALPLK